MISSGKPIDSAIILEGNGLGVWLQRSIGRVVLLIGLGIFLIGGVTQSDMALVLESVTLPLLTLLGLSVIALSINEIGVLGWVAQYVADLSRQRILLLFNATYFFCSIMTVVFPNDATILLLTPLVIQLYGAIFGHKNRDSRILPLVYAVVFGANAASISLVTSNPINMIFAEQFGIPYLEYAKWMVLPGTVSTLTCYVALRWVFRHQLSDAEPQAADMHHAARENYGSTARWDRNYSVASVIVAGMFIGYFVLSALGFAYQWAILTGSVLILGPLLTSERASFRRVVERLPWDALFFVIGMFVIAYWFVESGILEPLIALTQTLAHRSLLEIALGNGLLTTVSANLINDWPTATLSALTVNSLPAELGARRELFAYTSIISANLGNKIIPSGSLATLIWMRILTQIASIEIRWLHFIKVGLIVTPLTLLSAVLCLWLLIAFAA